MNDPELANALFPAHSSSSGHDNSNPNNPSSPITGSSILSDTHSYLMFLRSSERHLSGSTASPSRYLNKVDNILCNLLSYTMRSASMKLALANVKTHPPIDNGAGASRGRRMSLFSLLNRHVVNTGTNTVLTTKQGAIYAIMFVTIITVSAALLFSHWYSLYSDLLKTLAVGLVSNRGHTLALWPKFIPQSLGLMQHGMDMSFVAGDIAMTSGVLRENDLPLLDRLLTLPQADDALVALDMFVVTIYDEVLICDRVTLDIYHMLSPLDPDYGQDCLYRYETACSSTGGCVRVESTKSVVFCGGSSLLPSFHSLASLQSLPLSNTSIGMPWTGHFTYHHIFPRFNEASSLAAGTFYTALNTSLDPFDESGDPVSFLSGFPITDFSEGSGFEQASQREEYPALYYGSTALTGSENWFSKDVSEVSEQFLIDRNGIVTLLTRLFFPIYI